jgi:hypothetical protein
VLVRIQIKWVTHLLLVGISNCIATLENNWAVSYEIKMQLVYNPEISLLGICPREMKIMFTQKPVHNCSLTFI